MTDADMLERADRFLDESPEGVLPTAALSEDAFEAFVELLLAAHRHALPTAPRRIEQISRWGRRGDKQDGIDLAGTWDNGTEVAFQCKRWRTLRPAQIPGIVHETSFAAQEYVLVFSGVASAPTRTALRQHHGWLLWDARDLRQILDELPLQRRRDVLDRTWSPEVRRRILHDLPSDAFVSTTAVRTSRRRDGQLLNDRGAFVGMTSQRKRIVELLQNGADGPTAIIVHGPGGTGKTRLIAEAAAAFEQQRPEVPVLWLGPGVTPDRDALAELPLLPSVVIVDDAHLLATSLAALVRHVVAYPGTRLLLGSRDPAVEQLHRELIAADVPTRRIGDVRTNRLSLAAARRLVSSLAGEMTLQYPFVERLARLTVDTPAVAVIAIGLLRDGTLQDDLQLDENLRAEIFARYGNDALDDVAGAPANAAHRLYAIVAALGSVNIDDPAFKQQLRNMTGWSLRECVAVFAALKARNLIVGNPEMRAATELLADQVLEQEAMVIGQDTGFIGELWEHFADSHLGNLFPNLGALAWRLGEQARPSLLEDVWADVHARVHAMDHYGLIQFLSESAQLASTQPTSFIAILDQVIDRLDRLDASGDAQPGLRWFDRASVEHRLASLYADAGVHDPTLIPHVLDRLWMLGCRDSRRENPTPGHPFRLIRERFGDYAALPSLDAPNHLVDAVERWIGDAVTPIPLLTPLLSKTSIRRYLSDRRTMTFEPISIAAAWSAPIRDRVRTILITHPEHARESIPMLRGALMEPRPAFGAVPTRAEILQWETDDLATLEALQSIADRVGTAAVRRTVRNALDWPASRAESATVRRNALAMTTVLDADPEDDFAELLVGTTLITPHIRLGRGSAAGRGEDRMEQVDSLFHEALTKIWPNGYTVEGFVFLDTQAREAAMISERHVWKLLAVAAALRSHAAHLVLEVTAAITAQVPGPLDDILPSLLADASAEEIAAAAAIYRTLRPEVRRAYGIAAAQNRWRNNRSEAAELLRQGRADGDADVRQAFLRAYDTSSTFPFLRDELIEGDATAFTIETVLEDAGFAYGGADTHPVVTESDVSALLDPADRLDGSAGSLSRVLAATAKTAPQEVLAFLNRHRDGYYAPDVSELFDGQEVAVAEWLLERSSNDSGVGLELAATTAIGDPMPAGIAAAVVDALATADAATVDVLTDLLAGFSAWASFNPSLARAILEHGDRPPGSSDRRRSLIEGSTVPSHWGSGPGGSPELNRALHAAHAAVAVEPNDELRELLETGIRIMTLRLEDIDKEDDDDERDDAFDVDDTASA